MGGQVLGYGGSGEGASQDADERDANLDGGQKAVRGIGQLQCRARSGVALLAALLQPHFAR